MATTSIPQSNPATDFSQAFNGSFGQAQSLAFRNQELQQSQKQFDVIAGLKQQEFGLQQQQTMAQVAMYNADTDFKKQQLKQAQQEADINLNKKPLAYQDVSQATAKALGTTTNLDDFDKNFYSNLSPDTTKYVDPNVLQQHLDTARAQFAQTQTQQTILKQAALHQQTLAEGVPLGVDPTNFIRKGVGQDAYQQVAAGNFGSNPNAIIDMNAYSQAVNQAQAERSIEIAGAQESAKTQAELPKYEMLVGGKEAVANINQQGRVEAAGVRGDQRLAQTEVTSLNNRATALDKLIQNETDPDKLQMYKDAKFGVQSRLNQIQSDASKTQQATNAATPTLAAPAPISPPTGKISWADRIKQVPPNQPTFIGPNGKPYINPNFKG